MLRIKKEKPECLPIEKVIFKMLAHLYNGYTHYESYDLEFCFQSTQKKDQFTLHQKQPKKKKKFPRQITYVRPKIRAFVPRRKNRATQ